MKAIKFAAYKTKNYIFLRKGNQPETKGILCQLLLLMEEEEEMKTSPVKCERERVRVRPKTKKEGSFILSIYF